MSFDSVAQQMAALITGSGLVTSVLRADEFRLGQEPQVIVTPDQCPAVIIMRGDSTERWMSVGIADRTTPYRCDLWFYSSNTQADGPIYDNLLESVQDVLRSNPSLAGGADTAKTHVLYLSIRSTKPTPRPLATPNGRAVYHSQFQVDVREEVRT